jgi:hypothetical protein
MILAMMMRMLMTMAMAVTITVMMTMLSKIPSDGFQFPWQTLESCDFRVDQILNFRVFASLYSLT